MNVRVDGVRSAATRLLFQFKKSPSSSVLGAPTQTRGPERRPALTPNQNDILEQLNGVLLENLKTFVYLGAV
jgi:hypothetical protein